MTDKHIIHITASVTDALAKLNALSGGVMTLVVEDGRGRVAGTVTDGDIRRALIDGTWIDIGTPADYRHACEMMNFHRLAAL